MNNSPQDLNNTGALHFDGVIAARYGILKFMKSKSDTLLKHRQAKIISYICCENSFSTTDSLVIFIFLF